MHQKFCIRFVDLLYCLLVYIQFLLCEDKNLLPGKVKGFDVSRHFCSVEGNKIHKNVSYYK